jgi:hypothetical protein
MSKNKAFNTTLDNGKQVTVQLDKSDQTYDVAGAGYGYASIKDVQSCKFLNRDSPETKGENKSKNK